MSPRPVFLSIVLMILLLFCGGCSDDQKGDYKGVSDLIASRNQARSSIKKQSGSNTASEQKQIPETEQDIDPSGATDSPDAEMSPIILYEEKVIIVSQGSDKTLAKGIAYINKQGRIVRLKIVND